MVMPCSVCRLQKTLGITLELQRRYVAVSRLCLSICASHSVFWTLASIGAVCYTPVGGRKPSAGTLGDVTGADGCLG